MRAPPPHNSWPARLLVLPGREQSQTSHLVCGCCLQHPPVREHVPHVRVGLQAQCRVNSLKTWWCRREFNKSSGSGMLRASTKCCAAALTRTLAATPVPAHPTPAFLLPSEPAGPRARARNLVGMQQLLVGRVVRVAHAATAAVSGALKCSVCDGVSAANQHASAVTCCMLQALDPVCCGAPTRLPMTALWCQVLQTGAG